jgi:ATP-dependent RNA helicase DeaD
MENDRTASDGRGLDGSGAGEQETVETGFARLGLGPAALQAVASLGYESPTAVQERAIPVLLEGRDLIAQAPTGTGKTAAYGLPIVDQLTERDRRTQALVVVPTRELAIQVADALGQLGGHRHLVALPVYGGQPYDRQLRALARGIQVVVGTPGRLLDHLARGTLVLDQVRTVVLDEADEMLNMGFVEDIEKLLGALPAERQTALFSATIPQRIRRLAEQYLRDARHVSVEAGSAVAPMVRQVYYDVPWTAKPDALARILESERPESAIVFVRTRRDADVVAEHVSGLGYSAHAIHGDISQAHRERVLDSFRAGHTRLLVGTDVAGRGLDIPAVSHVINYDLPPDAEIYVHRIGRTGRAGSAGEAITLVTPRERGLLAMLERGIHRRLERRHLPTDADLADRRLAAFRDELLGVLEADGLEPFAALVNELSASHDLARLAAAAFRMAAHRTPAPPVSERQVPARPASEPVRADHRSAGPDRRASEPVPSRRTHEPMPVRARYGAGGHPPRGSRDEVTARLFLRVGKHHGVRPADLVGAIANEAGIPSHSIGEITLFDRFSFVDVPETSASHVEAALNNTSIRGHAPRATLARPQAHADRSPRSGPSYRDRRAG